VGPDVLQDVQLLLVLRLQQHAGQVHVLQEQGPQRQGVTLQGPVGAGRERDGVGRLDIHLGQGFSKFWQLRANLGTQNLTEGLHGGERRQHPSGEKEHCTVDLWE
jgi:hypothetical protein